MRKMRSRAVCLSAAAAAALFCGIEAKAQTRDLTWDIDNGSAGPSGDSSTGYWENGGAKNWLDGATRVAWTNTPGDSAFFGSTNTAYIGGAIQNGIYMVGPISVQNMTFGVGSNGLSYNVYNIGENGAGPLTIGGNITKTVPGGQLKIAGDQPLILTAGNHVVAMNDTPADVPEVTINAPIQGAGDLTVDNGGYQAWGTLELNYNNSYAGKTTINKGRIAITDPGALGTASVGTTIGAMGTLSIAGAGTRLVKNLTIAEPITITRNTYTGGDFGLYPAALITYNDTGNTTFTGPFVIDSTDARIRAQTSTITIASAITTGANAASVLTLDGDTAGFVRLTGNNVGIAQGGVRVVGGVELQLDNENQRGGATAPLTFSGGYVRFNGGYKTSFAGMNVNFGSFNGGLDIAAGETFTINENLTGGSLSMRGTGTMNIGGTNALSGASFYDGGIVNVSGSHSIGGLRMRNAVMNVLPGAALATTSTFTSIGIVNGENATLNIGANARLTAANQDFNVGDTSGSQGTMNMAAGSTAVINGRLMIGKNPNVIGTVNLTGANVTLNNETWIGNATGTGTFRQSGGTTTANNWFVVGRDRATGTAELSNGAMLIKKGGGNVEVDFSGVDATNRTPSVMTLKDASTFDVQAGWLRVGVGNNSNGTLNVTENSTVSVASGELHVGTDPGSNGTLNITGNSTVSVANNWIGIGRDNGTGVVNIISGTLNKAGNNNVSIGWQPNSNGKIVQTGGAFNVTSGEVFIGEGGVALYDASAGTADLQTVRVGQGGGNSGELRVSGTAAVKATNVVLANGGSVTGLVNLSGGSLTANAISGGGGTGTKTLNLNGGTLRAGLDGANLVSGLTAANVQAGGANIDSNGKNVNMSQALLGAAAGAGLNKVGAGTLTLASSAHTYSGATNVDAGTLRVTGSVFNSAGVNVNSTGTFEAPVAQKVRALTVNAGGLAALPTAASPFGLTVGDGTSGTSPFNVGAGSTAGKVDINKNGLIVDVVAGGESSALTSVRTAALAAYNGGAWNGNGLTSSQITSSNRLAIGFGLPTEVPAALTASGTQFFGSAVDASAVVVQTTVGGDANLDKTVNFDDLLALAKNYNRTDGYWAKGDFNYDGNINFDDLLVLAKNYNQTMPSEAVPGATADFKADMAAAFAAAVPEPTSLGLLGIGAGALLGRRRRSACRAK